VIADRDDRVLAIMMKAPRPGWVKTRLAAAYSAEQIVALYRALVEDTIDLARQTQLRVVAMCPDGDAGDLADWLPADIAIVPQQGAGLAAGLRSTFERFCTDSHDRVIAFNADSPHLPAGALQAAFEALLATDLVVGPCDDGGYYLVGATRPHAGLFDAAAMGRASACQALLEEAGRQGLRVTLTAEHYDIDLPADVIRLSQELDHDPSRAARTASLLSAWSRDSRAS
jgi:rSAM/selenodomain-associated transferase 1